MSSKAARRKNSERIQRRGASSSIGVSRSDADNESLRKDSSSPPQKNKLTISQLVYGFSSIPSNRLPDAVDTIIGALHDLSNDSSIEVVTSVLPFFQALIELKEDFFVQNSRQRRRFLDLWPFASRCTRSVAASLLRDEDVSVENGIRLVVLIFSLFSLCGEEGKKLLREKGVCKIAISIWMNSYKGRTAQYLAVEVLAVNYSTFYPPSRSLTTATSNDLLYRDLVLEVAKDMRMDPHSLITMSLKRLLRVIEAPFTSRCNRADYHLSALVMMLNPGPSGKRTAFNEAFERARGVRIMGQLLIGIFRTSKLDRDDEFITYALSIVTSSLQCATRIETICQALHCNVLEALAAITSMLEEKMGQPCTTEFKIMLESASFVIGHVLPEALLFNSTVKYFEKGLKGWSWAKLAAAGVLGEEWAKLRDCFKWRKDAYNYIGTLKGNSCANPKCSVKCGLSQQMSKCEDCEFVLYCSRKCQVEAWKLFGHREECLGFQSLKTRTGLSVHDAVMLSSLAYHCARSQILSFSKTSTSANGKLGILIDFAREVFDGSLTISKFDTATVTSPDLQPLDVPYFWKVNRANVKLETVDVVIQVHYALWMETRNFGFFAKFEKGILDGSLCSCCPFPLRHRSFCAMHRSDR